MAPYFVVAAIGASTDYSDELEPFDSERICILWGNMLICRYITGGGESCLKQLQG